MSQICAACGRGALTGNLRSKALNTTKMRQKVNLQPRRIEGKRVKICTRCVKTRNKNPETFTLPSPAPARLTKRRTKRSK